MVVDQLIAETAEGVIPQEVPGEAPPAAAVEG
jgi:hypothetical protein